MATLKKNLSCSLVSRAAGHVRQKYLLAQQLLTGISTPDGYPAKLKKRFKKKGYLVGSVAWKLLVTYSYFPAGRHGDPSSFNLFECIFTPITEKSENASDALYTIIKIRSAQAKPLPRLSNLSKI